MEDKFCTYKRVGYFKDKMAQDIGIRFTGTIYASPGVIKHIKINMENIQAEKLQEI